MESSKKNNKVKKTSHSDELMHLPEANGCLRSKLLLSPQLKVPPSGPRKTYKLGQSSVLSRAKQFLPQMAEADKKLKEDIESDSANGYNIENVADDEPHIEMNFALVENAENYADSDSVEDESSSSEDLDSDVEIPTEYRDNGPVTEDTMRIHKKGQGKKPVIEELKT